jgi:hypothetical protein
LINQQTKKFKTYAEAAFDTNKDAHASRNETMHMQDLEKTATKKMDTKRLRK